MASKKFSFDRISEPNPLGPIIKDFDTLGDQIKKDIKLVELLAKEIAKTAKENPLEGFKDIEKLNDSLGELTDQQKTLDKQQKLLIKNTQTLNTLRDKESGQITTQAVEQEKLKLQIQATRREAKRLADEAINGSNAYKDLSKATNEAQANFKKLAAQFGVTSKEAKEAEEKFGELHGRLEEIDEAAKDGRRNVGRYTESINRAKLGVQAFSLALKAAIIGLLLKAVQFLSEAFSANSKSALAMSNAFGAITVTAQVLVGRIVLLSGVIKKIFMDALVGVKHAMIETMNVFNISAKTINVLGKEIEIFSGITVISKEKVEESRKEYDKWHLSAVELFGVFGEGIDVFKGVTEEIAAKNKVMFEANKLDQQFIILNAELRLQIARTTVEIEKHRAVLDDDGVSLEKRLKAAKETLKHQLIANEKNVQIAKNEEELALLRKESSTDNIEAEAAHLDAVTNRINAEVEASEKEIAIKREMSILKLDILDLELDFILDDADNRKAINERVAADEKESLEDRQKAIKENTFILINSFEKEIEAFNKYQLSKGQGLIDFDAIMKASTDEEIRAILERVEVAERAQLRALNVIKDRRTFIRDQTEGQQDLNDVLVETTNINKDIELQEEALLALQKDKVNIDKVLTKLEDKRVQQNIDNLRKTLDAAKENSEERINIEQELNDALLDQQINKIKKEKDLEDDRKDEIIESLNLIFQALENASDNFFDKRLAQIDEELSLEQKRQSELTRLANDGNELAQKNLDLQQKRQKELEAERRATVKRQQQAELALAAAKTYSAKVSQGDKNAFASTIAEISALQAFINALPAFIEGTERVDKDLGAAKVHGGTDGYIARFDGRERIMSPHQNMRIPKDMTNEDLVQAAQEKMAVKSMYTYAIDLSTLENQMREVKNAIDKKPVYLGMDWDARNKEAIHVHREHNKLIKTHIKNNGF